MKGVDMSTPGLPNMTSHSRNEIWPVREGICEIAILQGVDLPHLVCQIWALTVGMKYDLSEQESVKLPFYSKVRSSTPGLPNMSSHSRNEI